MTTNIVEREEEVREVITTSSSTLGKLYDTAKSIKDSSEDFMVQKVSRHNMYYDGYTNKLRFILYGLGNNDYTTSKDYSPTPFAMGQLCNKIGIPFNYLQKCCETGRGSLATDNVQSWLESYRKDLFIRTYKDTIRGILTNRYSVCDSDEVLDVLQSNSALCNMNVKGYLINPERFHLRLVDKAPYNLPMEDLYPGISIDSSDVGRCSLFVTFFIYKQVCTNGLVLPMSYSTLFRQKHIGISKKNFSVALTEALSKYSEVRDAVKGVLLNNVYNGEEKYKLAELEVEEKRKEIVRNLSSQLATSEATSSKVVDLFKDRVLEGKYSNTKWGLVNAVTEVAQNYSLETRLQLERSAGRLLVS